jgi:hypothetical protein
VHDAEQEVTGDCRALRSEEHLDFHPSLHIVVVSKPEEDNAYNNVNSIMDCSLWVSPFVCRLYKILPVVSEVKVVKS